MKNCLVVLLVGLCAATVFGDTWTNIGNPTGSFIGISTLSETQTWLCSSTLIYFSDGTSLVQRADLSTGLTLALQDICAQSPSNVWAAGYTYSPSPAGGRVFSFDGNTWTSRLALTNAGEASQLMGVYAASTSHVWACGRSQIWATTNGGDTWFPQYTNTSDATWYSIDGTDESHVWVAGLESAGTNALVMAFDGAAWTTNFSRNLDLSPLRDIDAASTNDVWAIGGKYGTVIRFRNGGWEVLPALSTNSVNFCGISRTPCGDTWAAAYGSGLYLRANDAWQLITNLPTSALRVQASPWHVFAEDFIYGLYVSRLQPEVDRVGSGIGFTWNSVPGRTYRIEWADDPVAPAWRAADQILASGWTSCWGDIGDGTTNRPAPAVGSPRIYRLVEP